MTTHGKHSGIIVLGEGLVGLVTEDDLATATTYRREPLGDGLITAVITSRMGIETSFVTRLGSDPYTEWLLATWDKERLHLDHVQHGTGTNTVVIASATDGLVTYRDSGSAATLRTSDVAHLPWTMSIFAYTTGSLQRSGGQTREALVHAFAEARRHGVRTVYNPTLRPNRWEDAESKHVREAFREIVNHTDILIIKAPFSCGQLLDEASAEEAAATARKLGVGHVIVRDPSGGCVVATERGTHVLSGDLRVATCGAESIGAVIFLTTQPLKTRAHVAPPPPLAWCPHRPPAAALGVRRPLPPPQLRSTR